MDFAIMESACIMIIKPLKLNTVATISDCWRVITVNDATDKMAMEDAFLANALAQAVVAISTSTIIIHVKIIIIPGIIIVTTAISTATPTSAPITIPIIESRSGLTLTKE